MLARIVALIVIVGVVVWLLLRNKNNATPPEPPSSAAAIAPPPVPTLTEPRCIGCFKDGTDRTMEFPPSGNPTFMTHDACRRLAAASRKRYFATQYTQPDGTAQCFLASAGDGSLQRIKQLGAADNCAMVNNRIQGREWSNAVYEIL